jgi:alkanesulfonate monooxygenase SsuD/methylene tetrahydromethanopterin reductase-like flavin-dependent oxidoreductase (luciferase family)
LQGDDVGPAGRDYRASHDIEADVRAAQRSGRGLFPRVGMSRTVYAAADRDTAMAHMESGVLAWLETLVERGTAPSGLSREEAFARNFIHYGSPEEVVASIREDRLLPLSTDLICQVQPGHPTPAQILRSLELIAREVAPALGWRPNGATSAEPTSAAAVPMPAVRS